MKPGWVDFKWIKNAPQQYRPVNGPWRLVSPTFIVRLKLGYDQYRSGTDEQVISTSDSAPQLLRKRELSEKLGYDQFRPKESLSAPKTERKTGKKHSGRSFQGPGLGHDRETISANLVQLAGRDFLTVGLVFSEDPGLLQLVDEAGIDLGQFTASGFEQFVNAFSTDRGWGNWVDYTYVIHENRDRLGRRHPHIHATMAGTVLDPDTGERRSLPRIYKDDLRRAHIIADRVVEQQLDLALGREWRLQVPEYAHTYDQMASGTVVADVPDVPVVASEGVPLRPPEVFSSALDSALKRTLEGLPIAPTVLFDARDLEFDSFGDEEVLAGLIADLFGNEFVPPKLPVQSAGVPSIEPNNTDEGATEPSHLVPESPILEPFTRPSAGLQTPHLAITLTPYWLPELGVGAIQASTTWLDPATGTLRHGEAYIYQTSVLDEVFFYADRVDFDESMLDAQSALETQLTALQSTLAKDHDQGICDLYKVWFETMALDVEAIQNGFLPDVPRQLLPDTIDIPNADWTRLPGVKWVYDAEQNVEYGFTAVMTAPDENEYYTRQALRRWSDENGVQQVDIVGEVSEAEPLKVSVQMLWATAKRLEHDFADASLRAEQQLWRAQFDSPIELLGVDLNEVEDFEYETDELEQGDNDDSRDMHNELDTEF